MRELYRTIAGHVQHGLQNPKNTIEHVYGLSVGNARLKLTGQYQTPTEPHLAFDDWTVAVILDACRYDVLSKQNPFDASCERQISQATNTPRWFTRNFLEIPRDTVDDIIYVTANPWVEKRSDDRFYDVEPVFEYGWDEDDNTVHPEVVTRAALRCHHQYPDKRIVAHYNQPHAPFVGTDLADIHENNYEALRAGDVTASDAIDAYTDCLQYALDSVETLVQYVSGDIVITADHGEAFGEGGVYGHPPWARAKVLLEVPRIDLSGRGESPPVDLLTEHERQEPSTDVDDQLEHLGYKI